MLSKTKNLKFVEEGNKMKPLPFTHINTTLPTTYKQNRKPLNLLTQ